MSPSDKRIAIIVDPSLAIGLLANTVATIAIGVGAVEPAFGNVSLTDRAPGDVSDLSASTLAPLLRGTRVTLR